MDVAWEVVTVPFLVVEGAVVVITGFLVVGREEEVVTI
jgi:hypothetical protein